MPAPDKDWLTEAEVLVLLGDISGRTLDRYIRDGLFPAAVLWGRDPRWRWEDVAWYHLGKLLSPRLAAPEASPDDDAAVPGERHDDDTGTTRRRHRNDNPRQSPAGG